MGKWAVDARELRLLVKGRTCLEVPELKIQQGERVLIRGTNGSGKTLLLKLLSGLLKPDSGQLMVLQQNLREMSLTQRDQFRADHIGFIFQNPRLLPYLPAIENILLPCRFSAVRSLHLKDSGTTEEYEAFSLMAKLKLEDPTRLRLCTRFLSTGLQQRVAIARGLIGAPDLILADEPAASLDRLSSKTVYDLLLSTARETGTTLVCITQDEYPGFDRVLSMADINPVLEANPIW